MSASLKVVDRGLKKIKQNLADLAKSPSYVKVGLLGNGKKRPSGELSNAELGIIHEFGTSTIPARPFIKPGFEKNKETYLKMLRNGVKGDLKGSHSGARETTLALIGMKAAADMKAFVVGGPEIPPPNTESTRKRKEAKRARGNVAPVRTLVDTGRMVGAITYAVVKAGEK